MIVGARSLNTPLRCEREVGVNISKLISAERTTPPSTGTNEADPTHSTLKHFLGDKLAESLLPPLPSHQ